MPNPKSMAMFGLSFITVLLVLMVCVMLAGCASTFCETVYELPSGTFCKYKEEYQRSAKFYGCSDGKIYYNPEWSKETSACHK